MSLEFSTWSRMSISLTYLVYTFYLKSWGQVRCVHSDGVAPSTAISQNLTTFIIYSMVVAMVWSHWSVVCKYECGDRCKALPLWSKSKEGFSIPRGLGIWRLTWLYSCQQYTFTQCRLHSPHRWAQWKCSPCGLRLLPLRRLDSPLHLHSQRFFNSLF